MPRATDLNVFVEPIIQSKYVNIYIWYLIYNMLYSYFTSSICFRANYCSNNNRYKNNKHLMVYWQNFVPVAAYRTTQKPIWDSETSWTSSRWQPKSKIPQMIVTFSFNVADILGDVLEIHIRSRHSVCMHVCMVYTTSSFVCDLVTFCQYSNKSHHQGIQFCFCFHA